MEQKWRFYNCMENAIHEIYKDQIKLKKEQMSIRNYILKTVIRNLLEKFKKLDPLLHGSEIYYGGSYFCGTKIKLPDEYDIDILIKLPMETRLIAPEDGFLALQLPNFDKNVRNGKYSTLSSFLDESNYVLPEKVQNWYKSIIQKSLNKFAGGENNCFKMNTRYGCLSLTMGQSGPAITIHLEGKWNLKIDVDLVPCFKFGISDWIKLYPVKSNGKIKHSDVFFIVPKPPKDQTCKDNRLWRPSFQREESLLIHNMSHLKPSIKLLKLLKEQMNHKSIKSYYMKMVVMTMLVSGDYPKHFWVKNSLSFVFMNVLKYYSKCLEEGHIFSIWYEKLDLLNDISETEKLNISNRIKHMIEDLDNCIKMKESDVRNVLKKHFDLATNEK